MIGSRFFLVLVRLVVASVGALLSAFKFIKPESTPAFLKLPEFGDNSSPSNLPWDTNPVLAKSILLLVFVTSIVVIVGTVVTWIRERAKYGGPTNLASWPVLAGMFIGMVSWFWYSLVAVLTENYWGFVFSLGVVGGILFFYEFAGYGDKK